MSDTTNTVAEAEQEEQAPTGAQGLRAQAEKVPGLEATNVALQKELAFAKAGVPEEGQIATLFRNSYDGPATAEAVSERWQQLATELHASGVQVDAGTSAAEAVATTHATTQVGVPGSAPPAPPEDPVKVGYEKFREARMQGVPEEDAANEVIGRIMHEAFNPDPAHSDRFVLVNVPGHGEMTRQVAKAKGYI